jgi:hypothetical protein
MKILFRFLGGVVAVLFLLAVVADLYGRSWQAVSGRSVKFAIVAISCAVVFLVYAFRRKNSSRRDK